MTPARSGRWKASIFGTEDSIQPHISFVEGMPETSIPEIRLTRSMDGLTGTASFTFKEPISLPDNSAAAAVTGMMMSDDEGILQTIDIEAQFDENDCPVTITAKHVMNSPEDWDRFMRFMERYAKANDLSFQGPGVMNSN
mmetsp:Transcript_32843/g.52832  ORF Transcript_32843/g.52832 Transcript_32843/m.52832 type:complete len:140 (-) Transcript_32843:154-573(-)